MWHTMRLTRINAKIAAVQQRQAETEHGRRHRREPRNGRSSSASAPDSHPSRSTPAIATWRASGAARSGARGASEGVRSLRPPWR